MSGDSGRRALALLAFSRLPSQAGADHHGGAGEEAGGDEVAACHRQRVIVVQQRLAERVRAREASYGSTLSVTPGPDHCSVTTALPSTAVHAAWVAVETVALLA